MLPSINYHTHALPEFKISTTHLSVTLSIQLDAHPPKSAMYFNVPSPSFINIIYPEFTKSLIFSIHIFTKTTISSYYLPMSHGALHSPATTKYYGALHSPCR